MTTGIILCIVLAGLIACLIVFRNTLFVKKYWKYALILIPAFLIVIIKAFSNKKPPSPGETTELAKALGNVKEKLQEANMTATIEVTAAREKNLVKLEELKKATQIEDDRKRRERLAELMG